MLSIYYHILALSIPQQLTTAKATVTIIFKDLLLHEVDNGVIILYIGLWNQSLSRSLYYQDQDMLYSLKTLDQ
jgi:hypothetical protein